MRNSCAIFVAGLLLPMIPSRAEETSPLQLEGTVPLPDVKGRFDHFAVDLNAKRLFVAALGNNTVEVIDLEAGKRVHTIQGAREPQGLLFLPDAKQLVVAGGGDGSCRFYDCGTFKLLKTLDFKEDADNLRYDPSSKLVYVGYGDGALGTVTAEKRERASDVKLEGHPESFQIEKGGKRIFVNVPSARQIAVIDKEKEALLEIWPLKGAAANFPMALDESHRRLLVGCREPARLVALESDSGKQVASVECSRDADDLFYDASSRRIYISCGEGAIDVFEQSDADHYKLASRVTTAPGARTSLYVPDLRRLYLAVPHREKQEAEVRVYAVRP
jgi:WD40 repeat protein